jgi:hypothetical protein
MHEHDAWLARFDEDDGIDGELTMGAVCSGGEAGGCVAAQGGPTGRQGRDDGGDQN